MAQINKLELKNHFRKGNKPTESQFEDLIDSNINLGGLKNHDLIQSKYRIRC